MIGHRIPYIRLRDGRVIGWAVMVKEPDPPQHPHISKMGWPNPVGMWEWVEAV